VAEIRLEDETLLAENSAALPAADCVVIVTDHSAFDYKALVDRASLIVDTRNALKGFQSDRSSDCNAWRQNAELTAPCCRSVAAIS
jgi:UDP-N-acetyl-D-mannosaminuronate dehydrogenase